MKIINFLADALRRVTIKRTVANAAISIGSLLLGAPIAHGLIRREFGSDFPYGGAIAYAIICMLVGWFLVGFLLMGLKNFFFHQE